MRSFIKTAHVQTDGQTTEDSDTVAKEKLHS